MNVVEQRGVQTITIENFTPSIGSTYHLVVLVNKALLMHSLPAIEGYAKFPVGYEMGEVGQTVCFTLGSGIALVDDRGVINFNRLNIELYDLLTSRARSAQSNQSMINKVMI